MINRYPRTSSSGSVPAESSAEIRQNEPVSRSRLLPGSDQVDDQLVGDQAPALHVALGLNPSSVPWRTASRRTSPVDKWPGQFFGPGAFAECRS